MGWEEEEEGGAVILAGEDELDEEEEEEEEAAYGDVNVLRPGLGLEVAVAGLDFSGKGGCGG